MENRETILNELQQLSTLVAGISRVNPYQVPAGYFEAVVPTVMGAVRLQTIGNESKSPAFQVPKGYFEQLPQTILNRVKHQEMDPVGAELAELAPILNTISKRPVYQVPDGYFESLELTIPLKLDKPSARVFNFGKARRAMQFAVAAVFVALLVFGGWYINSGNNDQTAVISHDSALKMNVAQELSTVNEQEIASYLERSPVVGYVINATPTEDIGDIQDYIHSASDEEIRQYLNETAEPGEPLVNGS